MNHEKLEKLNKLIKGINIAMLTTESLSGTLVSRPMVTQDDATDGTLWFVTGKNSGKHTDISNNSQINLAYASTDDNIYVSVSGKASFTDERNKIEELWSPMMRGWFPDGKEDDNLTLLRVEIDSAEYWDTSSNMLVQLAAAAEALITGERPDNYAGEHERIA